MPRLRPYNLDILTPKKERHFKDDIINSMFSNYQKSSGIKRQILAYRVNLTPQAVSRKKQRGSEKFTLKEFKAWVKALEIPEDAAADAVYRYLMQDE